MKVYLWNLIRPIDQRIINETTYEQILHIIIFMSTSKYISYKTCQQLIEVDIFWT